MPAQGGADILLSDAANILAPAAGETTLELMIDSGVGGDPATAFYRPHYSHKISSLLASRTDISGKPGRQNIDQSILLWAYEDWTGGEGLKYYDSTKTTKYYKSASGNTRLAKVLQGTPTSAAASVGSFGVASGFVYQATGGGYVWLAASHNNGGANYFRKVYNSTDLNTWSTFSYGAAGTQLLQGAATDPAGNCFISIATAAPSILIDRFDTTLAQTNFATANPGGNTDRTFAPLTVFEGFLYLWTGSKLYKYDTTSGTPVAATLAGTATTASPASVSTAHAGMVSGGDRVVCFTNTTGLTQVFHYYRPTGSLTLGFAQMWTAPPDFDATCIGYSNGNVYLAGTQDGYAAIWGIAVSSLTPFFVGFIRGSAGTALTPTSISGGPGSQILVSCLNGTTEADTFVYDQTTGGISLLDITTVNGGTANDIVVGGLGANRFQAYWSDATTVSTKRWSSDFATTTSAASVETGAWDFDLPEQKKRLLGYHVISETLGGGKSVTIGYDIDETGSYTDFTTLSSGQNNFISALTKASTQTFRNLRTRIVTAGGAKVYSVTARADIPDYQETWEMSVRLKDEEFDQGHTRKRGTTGDRLRKALIAMRKQQRILTFQDGYVDRAPGTQGANSGYTTNTVVIDDVDDAIPYSAQGTCHIIVRSVTP